VSASGRDVPVAAAEGHDPLTSTPGKPRWLVTCSCGWEREASSEWAATAIAKLHVQRLSVSGTEHTITIEGPLAGGQQLTLT
jgi:hypothetical protein